jgi:hypothetical protein
LNVLADRQATQHMTDDAVIPLGLTQYPAKLYINDKQVTSNHKIHVRDAYQSKDIIQFIKNSNACSDETTNDVWWSIAGKAMNQFTMGEKTTLQKFLHNRLPTNQREHKYYSYLPSTCSVCTNVTETQWHIFQCPCEERKIIRKNLF